MDQSLKSICSIEEITFLEHGKSDVFCVNVLSPYYDRITELGHEALGWMLNCPGDQSKRAEWIERLDLERGQIRRPLMNIDVQDIPSEMACKAFLSGSVLNAVRCNAPSCVSLALKSLEYVNFSRISAEKKRIVNLWNDMVLNG